MKEKTKVKKMYILNGGSFLYDIGMMQLGTDLGKRFKTLQSLLGAQFLPGHDYDLYHNEMNLGEAYC